MDAEKERRHAESVLDLAEGMLAARAVQVVAETGVADLFPPEPGSARPVAELAEAADVDAGALAVALRLLATHDLFTEPEPGEFALTEAGAVLRSTHPMSVRSIVRHHGFNYPLVGRLDLALRTGGPVFTEVYGDEAFDYFRTHPERGEIFDAAMGDLSRMETSAVLGGFDFSPYKRVVDVGGGSGTLLASVLDSVPHATGVVFDQEHLAPAAEQVLSGCGAADRASFVAGDFFTDALPEGDLLVLKSILHDWPDEEAVAILRACRAALPPHGRVVLFERLLTDDEGPSRTRNWDVVMLLVHGGRERTEGDFRRLFAAAGLRFERSLRLHDTLFAVEAAAAPFEGS